ncbi:MAG TPA: hypothetical protein VHE55_14200 [Fimbriimonadaceae bacterium]|nr:hypothetical protein [Fimbriimonadaceae bacterium]
MLPLLPALILLLLQGPANVERMAGSGQLPGALQALHRQMASTPSETCKAEEVVFASLLAVSSDKDMSRILLRLLTFIEPPDAERTPIPASFEESSPPAPIPPSLGAPQDGYFDCRRSRDGPAGSLRIA